MVHASERGDRMKIWTRMALLICATLAVGGAVVPEAIATTVSLDYPSSPADYDQDPGAVDVVAGKGTKNHAIEVTYEADTDSFVITDSGRIGAIDPGCERMTARRVRCLSPGSEEPPDVVIRGGSGDDHLRADETVRGGVSLSGDRGRDVLRVAPKATGGAGISGGPDGDRIFAGGGDATLRGDAGADEILGGPGHDVIYDGVGSDLVRARGGFDAIYVEVTYSTHGHPTGRHNRIYMGAGVDQIFARNNHKDGLLHCGRGGDDGAIIDDKDQNPRACEHVERGRRSR